MATRAYKPTPSGITRGKCQRCGKILALGIKGKLHVHKNQDGRYCYGSKQLPL
jgi:hypothetical protein